SHFGSSVSFSILPSKFVRTCVTDILPPVDVTWRSFVFVTLPLQVAGIFEVSRGAPSGFGKNLDWLPVPYSTVTLLALASKDLITAKAEQLPALAWLATPKASATHESSEISKRIVRSFSWIAARRRGDPWRPRGQHCTRSSPTCDERRRPKIRCGGGAG